MFLYELSDQCIYTEDCFVENLNLKNDIEIKNKIRTK